MIKHCDDMVGRIIDAIDESKLDDNTMIMAERCLPHAAATGTIPATDRPELCSSIDFVPTILAATEAKGPHDTGHCLP